VVSSCLGVVNIFDGVYRIKSILSCLLALKRKGCAVNGKYIFSYHGEYAVRELGDV
jgi:hypothetical protein